MIGGRTRSSSRSKNLHFAPKPKRRTSLKVVAIVLVLIVLLVAAGAVKAAVTPAPGLTVRQAIPASRVLPGTPPKPAWPATGEAAVEVQGLPPLGTSGPTTPVPIASVAKIMTAYVVLHDSPLKPGANGFTITVSAADVTDYQQRLAQAQSVVPVAAGETLTELQLLQGLLVASGNNFAIILADHDAGSTSSFVAKMQSTARSLGMTHTTYTDPSGLLSSTVSTAGDQLMLADKAMANPVFASVVSMTSVTLPVAGQLPNFNRDVGTNGFTGIKTGSDATAGGCLVFSNRRTIGGHPVTIVGVVLGQDPGVMSTSALIAAASGAATALVDSVVHSLALETVVPSGTVVAVVQNAQGARVDAATTSPVTMMGYGGMRVPVRVAMQPMGAHLLAGTEVARLSLPGGAYSIATAQSTMPAVSFGWKLLHDY